MTQKQCVIEALVNLGGMATFLQLYAKTDTSKWGTKTPFASIRGIVQTNKEFYKIRPGLWGLKDFEAQNTAKTGDGKSGINPSFTHASRILSRYYRRDWESKEFSDICTGAR